jgi:hypothetical protein
MEANIQRTIPHIGILHGANAILLTSTASLSNNCERSLLVIVPHVGFFLEVA